MNVTRVSPMRLVLQDLKKGKTWLEEVPVPVPDPGEVLLRTRRTVVSPGTERMLVEFGRAGLLGKARAQPARVRQVLDKARADGLLPTLEAVRAKLDEPVPLGYCHAGVVEESNATRWPRGTRLASNGPHGDFVVVGEHLTAAIPDGVSDEAAAFAPLAAIALQAVRLAAPTLGETVLVSGLGVVGLLAVQLLRANGCNVIATEIKPERLELGRRFGAQVVDLSSPRARPVEQVMGMTEGLGVDAVIVAASAKSSAPLREGAEMLRECGRLVLAGVTGMELDRTPFFRKEISFQVSGSYGPGRYDPAYQDGRVDYPRGRVRWTAQRNFEAVLQLMAEGRLDPLPLVTHRERLERAPELYDRLCAGEEILGAVLEYDADPAPRPLRRHVALGGGGGGAGRPRVAVIGAGNFSRRHILPVLGRLPCSLHTLVSRRGASAAAAGRRFAFRHAATDAGAVYTEPAVDAVVIATRHDTHARLASAALRAGKAVYLEKPLAMSMEGLASVQAVLAGGAAPARLMVGFNRRHSPHLRELRRCRMYHRNRPVLMDYLVNAGRVPAGSWVVDDVQGGGRLIGEVCHFIDTMRFLAGSPLESLFAQAPAPGSETLTLALRFADGSLGTIHYWTDGPRSYPKERLTMMVGGHVATMDNFRRTAFTPAGAFRNLRTPRQDKGHGASLAAFIGALGPGGNTPPDPMEAVETTLATFATAEALQTGLPQDMAAWWHRLEAAVEGAPQ